MTFTLEVMLRGEQRVYTEQIDHAGEPATWTAADGQVIVRQMLQFIDGILNPGQAPREVELRGVNWIVNPYQEHVVIAFEIPSASAVAGPFDVAPSVLEALLVQTFAAVTPPSTVH